MSPTFIDIALAGLNVEPGIRDAIIGDLIEARTELSATLGERSANRWMRREALRSFPPIAIGALRTGGLRLILGITGAALAALALVSGLVGVSAALLDSFSSGEKLRQLTVFLLAIDLVYGVVGGYLAARFGRSAPLASAFAFGLLCVPITIVSTAGTAHSSYGLVLTLLLIPATVGGGWLRAHRLARTSNTVAG